ncbi:hypothetical protein EDB84DRAFT_1441450, partial [Lactarius hengduanensis]
PELTRYLRERLDGQEVLFTTSLTQLKARTCQGTWSRAARKIDGKRHQHGCPEGSPPTFSLLRHVFLTSVRAFDRESWQTKTRFKRPLLNAPPSTASETLTVTVYGKTPNDNIQAIAHSVPPGPLERDGFDVRKFVQEYALGLWRRRIYVEVVWDLERSRVGKEASHLIKNLSRRYGMDMCPSRTCMQQETVLRVVVAVSHAWSAYARARRHVTARGLIISAASRVEDRSHHPPLLPSIAVDSYHSLFLDFFLSAMPALISMHNTLGALFIGTVLSSIIYGVTWLQSLLEGSVASKFFACDSANLFFVVYTTYHVGITNFGDYLSNAFKPLVWGQTLFSMFLYSSTFSCGAHEVTLAEKDVASTRIGSIVWAGVLRTCQQRSYWDLTYTSWAFAFKHVYPSSDDVLCDVLITFGMVYYFLSNRTQVRRTNNVLNLLAIYAINCGTLHLVFAVSSVTLLAKYRDTLISTPSLFIMFRLSLCAFMAIPWGTQNTAEASTSAVVPKSRPPFSVYSDTSFSASVIAFEREMHPVPPVPEVVTAWISQGYHNRRALDLIFYDV